MLFFRLLLPKEAVETRKSIKTWIDRFGSTGLTDSSLEINLDALNAHFNFHTSHALAVLGRYGYEMNVKANYKFEDGFKYLIPFLESPDLGTLKLMGEDSTEGASDKFESALDYNLEYSIPPGGFDCQTGWRNVGKFYHNFVQVLQKRKKPLFLDITGQSLEPKYFNQLARIPLIELEDEHREDDEQEADTYNERMSSLIDFETNSDEEGDFDDFENDN